MPTLTDFRVVAGAALGLAAVVIAGAGFGWHPRPETPEASTLTAAAEQASPTVSYWHVRKAR